MLKLMSLRYANYAFFLPLVILFSSTLAATQISVSLEPSIEQMQSYEIPQSKIILSKKDAERIGQRVWLNEGAGKLAYLVSWNLGENFASVGIGHFIWFPNNANEPFKETFPALLAYFEQRGVTLPIWLTKEKFNPWTSREAFLQDKKNRTTRYVELENLLTATMSYQVEFMVQRLNNALPLMLESINSEKEREYITKQFNLLSYQKDGSGFADGIYALLDYINFKGEGVKETERYNDQGWGLLQVLQNMSQDSSPPLFKFANSAKLVLANRIKNSPVERNEERWRMGWNKRIDTYTQ